MFSCTLGSGFLKEFSPSHKTVFGYCSAIQLENLVVNFYEKYLHLCVGWLQQKLLLGKGKYF